MNSPVHVLGWGSTSALGVGTEAALQALRRGVRPAAPARRSSHLAPTPGGPLPVCEVPLDHPDPGERARAVLDTAVDEALAMAGTGGRTGVFAGTTGGFFVDGEHALEAARREDPDAWPPFLQRGAGALSDHVARRVGATGPIATFSTACTSSSVALVSATRHLMAGTCDRALVVGFDMLTSVMLHGFRSLLLVDSVPSRPFDATRAGLQLGEGCGVVVLGTREGPFRVGGSANVLNAEHLTSTAIDGSTAEEVMQQALSRSGVEPGAVVTIKAHGTGTRDNDLAEGRGIHRLFGEAPPRFASLKGALGHTLGAAGSLEMALWLGALQRGFVPGTVGFSEADPDIGLAPPPLSDSAPRGVHLFNAFGFGGSSVAQVVFDA